MSTRMQPTEGRIVWVYSNAWTGRRPGIVARVIGLEQNPQQELAGVTTHTAKLAIDVFLDPTVDKRGPVVAVVCELHDHDRLPEIPGITRDVKVHPNGEQEEMAKEWCYATWMPFHEVSSALRGQVASLESGLRDMEARINKGDNQYGPALSELHQEVLKLRGDVDNVLKSRGAAARR